ncbi:type II secretion system F family protein [Granulosicoccus antarcticus]|uniref:Type II secretion system protein F n=1 Tax=Granulosicoccus antarcticus IMCC3135 TaxID=1192854 RepID=A0A2Z2P494_9GAMM|nr:type II secretion system F family protein [Granulosicoccus antarcticus]ASJ76240.1 Putative type II secretion system protein F [Granulosicoccus antarcticus IMCC3135]
MSLSISINNTKSKERIAGSQASISLSLFHLHHLLAAGVGLGEALTELSEMETNRRIRQVWLGVTSRVEAGESLSEAMASKPRIFSALVIALIRSGEINGQLAIACDNARELLEWNRATKARMATVLLYPMFALLVLLAVVAFLFISVVPSLENFLAAGNADLAWHTRGLLALSDWMGRLYVPLIVCLTSLVVCTMALRQCNANFKLFSDHCLLRLPVAGALICELSLSRYAIVCGRLYRSGIELEQSMKISEDLVVNKALGQGLIRARTLMMAGTSLGEALSGISLIPASFRRLLAAGESAGALGQAMLQAGDQRQRHAQHLVERIERLAGPVTLMVVGVNLLWIVISVLGPVYDSAINAVMQS